MKPTPSLFLAACVAVMTACGSATGPAVPHDPFGAVILDWSALTSYMDSSVTYPDSFGVSVDARVYGPDSVTLIGDQVTRIRFVNGIVGDLDKCGEVLETDGYVAHELVRIDMVISTHLMADPASSGPGFAAPTDTVARYVSGLWDPLNSPNPAWGTDRDHFLVWRLNITDFTPLAPSTIAPATAEAQAPYINSQPWYNTCNGTAVIP